MKYKVYWEDGFPPTYYNSIKEARKAIENCIEIQGITGSITEYLEDVKNNLQEGKKMDELKKAFSEIYNDFYDNGYPRELVKNFDELLKTNKSFKSAILLFNEARKDFISSDREAAAFMAAYKKVLESEV